MAVVTMPDSVGQEERCVLRDMGGGVLRIGLTLKEDMKEGVGCYLIILSFTLLMGKH